MQICYRLFGIILCGLLSACTGLQYYDHLLTGQTQLLQQRRPLAEVNADPDISDALRQRLAQMAHLRAFASQQLSLPDNGSYRSYADLQRSYAVYNIFAAPELSLEPYRWCYWLIGCASYRGYFDRALAEQDAQRLQQTGYEVYIANIPAYSTLGWFDDPLLNTFIDWPLGLVAELVIHELTHQRLYIADDTGFNEAFASAVGQLGAQRWLRAQAPDKLEEYQRLHRYRDDFLALLFDLRQQLAALYASERSPAAKQEAKQTLFAATRQRYEALKQEHWQGFAGYDRWFAGPLNNARLVPITAYYTHIPAFLSLFIASGEEFALFYDQVEQLAALPAAERQQRLQALSADCRGVSHCNAADLAHRQSILASPIPPNAP
jgi:predicted aminopeptidase